MTDWHERDRAFLRWLRAASAQQLAAKWLTTEIEWRRVALARELSRRQQVASERVRGAETSSTAETRRHSN